MSKLPTPDYTPEPLGGRFPKCRFCGVHCTAIVRTHDRSGWELLCPGRVGGRYGPHRVPVVERSASDDFPPCRVCGAVPTALRPNYDETRLLRSFTFAGCGHTVGVPWEVAVGLA
ncbi:hypothetical protein ACWEDZ_32285 [Streptomyces sp. NPDC005047]